MTWLYFVDYSKLNYSKLGVNTPVEVSRVAHMLQASLGFTTDLSEAHRDLEHPHSLDYEETL